MQYYIAPFTDKSSPENFIQKSVAALRVGLILLEHVF